MELDEKYACVLLRRYVKNTKNESNVYCIRKGKKILYFNLVKAVE